MKILVTGGAGFIASHVVDAYVASGHEVIVLDDLSTGRSENLNPGARFYRVDIRSDEVAEILAAERPEVVNHHAAQMDVRRAVREPEFDASVNVVGSLKLLEAARSAGTREFLFASTGGAVYGEPERLPVDESHPVAPMSPYGLSKFVFEQYLALYRRLYRISYTVLRYPNVYGPRQNPHGEAGVVAIFAEQMLRGRTPVIFGDGNKTRDYVHVSDVVAASQLALGADRGVVFNVGRGEETSDRNIFELVRAAVGCDAEPRFAPERPGEIHRICLDSTKIRRELGWAPKVPLREGIEGVVQRLREKGSEP